MLFNALGGDTNPFASFLKKNQDAIAGFGRGMVGQTSLRDAMQGGFGGAYQMRPMDLQRVADQKAERDRQAQLVQQQQMTQKYSDFYTQNGMDDLAMAVQNGVPIKDTFTEYSKRKSSGDKGVEFGLSPIYGTDENGNPTIGQLGKDGSFRTVDTGGFNLSRDPIKMDAGTHFVMLDPITRQQIGIVPKNNFGAAYDSASGKVEGQADAEAKINLDKDIAKAEQALQSIESLKLNRRGMEETFGRIGGLIPQQTLPAIPGTAKADFQVQLDQLRGQTFLEAYQSLRGGGTITEIEGKKAESAIARLDTAQSREAFEKALLDLEDVIKKGMARAKSKAGVEALPDVDEVIDYTDLF